MASQGTRIQERKEELREISLQLESHEQFFGKGRVNAFQIGEGS